MNSYGIAGAALTYFDKSVTELTIAEAAYLAALPKGPNNYHPFRKAEAAIERRNWVIDRMVENGYVTQQRGRRGQEAAARRHAAQPRLLPLRLGLFRRGGAPRRSSSATARTRSTKAACRCAPRSIRTCR